MNNQETLSQFLANLNLLYNNLLEFYNKFAESMYTNNETVTAYQLTSDGETQEIQIPCIGYYTTQVRTLHQQMDAMVYANDNQISLQFQDGSVKKFEMQQISQLVQALESVQNSSFPVPTEIMTRTNWFFESFLNPLMFVNVNVSTLLQSTDIQKFAVKRVILVTNDEAQKTYFDQTIKGRTDLDYDQLISALDNEGIPYHIDDNVVDMPVAINRYRGSFTVVDIVQEDVPETNGTNAQMIYKLDRLTYYDLINGTPSVTVLAKGDTLVTSDDTEYEVSSVNKTDNTVVLEKKFGIGVINIGVDQLRMRPVAYRIPNLQVNIGYDERQIIFVSPISSKLDLATDKWSKGFAIYTNELTVTLSDGTILDLTTYYKNFVADFGAMFMNYAKERQIPASLAVTPSAPVLDANNFKVVPINTHIKESKSQLDLKAKISAKEKTENELDEVNKVIDKLKAKLNDSTTVNDIEKLKIKKEIDQNLIKKTNLLSQVATTIQEITLGLKTNSTFNTETKYRVRGFWDIPEPKETQHGTQSVVQFKVNYRYLSKKGNATNVDQIKFTGNTGQEKYGFFTNWNEVITKIRGKEYDGTKGVYFWSSEDVQDPDAVNINQVDIPINRGESVEIRVMSMSEAGYPVNPARSEWSNSVIVSFPDDLEATEEDAILSEQMFLDEAVMRFQQELNARGLDVHLLKSVYTGDKYYAHKAEEIASGYYTPEGKIKDVFMVMKEMQDQLTALATALQQDYGSLKVTLTDPLGNVMQVNNGTTMQLFAGYYKDLITDSNNTLQHGDIVTKTYVISIQNTSATVLELASRVIGGISERAPFDDNPGIPGEYLAYPTWIAGDTDYTRTRVYDKVPLVITSASANDVGDFKQQSPQQSSQICGQFVYGRFRDYGLGEELYFNDQLYFPLKGFYDTSVNATYLAAAPYNPGYAYTGKQFVAGEFTPSNGYMYFPFMYNGGQAPGYPSTPYGALTPEVWAGTYSPNPEGSGAISEFCIHIDHPALKSGYSYSIADMCQPAIGTSQSYPMIAHALHFNTTVDEKTDVFGAKYFQQCKYRKAVPYTSGSTQHFNYPVKNGFVVNDEYLIGKYTCGAYLFMAPNTYDDVVVEGNHPKFAKKSILVNVENAINIPVVFQFRCSDKLGYVGGYRHASQLQNVQYKKKIGIDIYQRDMTKKSIALYGDIFSFDIEVSCQYSNVTNIVTPITVPAGSLQQVTYNSTL